MNKTTFERMRWVVLLPIAVLYVFSLPHTVQNLDSGELAASAWNLAVPHPPGYPLHVWLHWAFVRILPWGSVYHRAAFATSLLMLTALAFLLKLARDWLGVALVAAFSTLPVVFLYAVLPDVFALHCAVSAALIYLTFQAPSARRTWFACAVFGLGAANHQTTIFLSPLLILILKEERRPLDRFGGLALGASVAILAYLSLLLMNNEHVYSWRHLQTTTDVLKHFLRADYGSFSLSHAAAKLIGVQTALTSILAPFAAVCVLLIGVALPHAFGRWSDRSTRAWFAVLACLASYVVILFPLLRVPDEAAAPAVLERFLIAPLLLLAALAITSAREHVLLRASLRMGLVAVVALTALTQVAIADTPALRNDTVIEDYARNLLTSAKHPTKNAILIARSDTQVYALRYVQAIEPSFEKVFVVPHGLMADPENLSRLRLSLPRLYDAFEGGNAEQRDVMTDFALPNSQRYAVTHVLPYTSPTVHTTFLSLGRRIEPGHGSSVDCDTSRFHPAPPVYRRDSPWYVESKALYAEYAICDLARAKELASAGDRASAKASALAGLDVVPYCIPCKRNVCALTDEPSARAECNREADDLEAQFDYLR